MVLSLELYDIIKFVIVKLKYCLLYLIRNIVQNGEVNSFNCIFFYIEPKPSSIAQCIALLRSCLNHQPTWFFFPFVCESGAGKPAIRLHAMEMCV